MTDGAPVPESRAMGVRPEPSIATSPMPSIATRGAVGLGEVGVPREVADRHVDEVELLEHHNERVDPSPRIVASLALARISA